MTADAPPSVVLRYEQLAREFVALERSMRYPPHLRHPKMLTALALRNMLHELPDDAEIAVETRDAYLQLDVGWKKVRGERGRLIAMLILTNANWR